MRTHREKDRVLKFHMIIVHLRGCSSRINERCMPIINWCQMILSLFRVLISSCLGLEEGIRNSLTRLENGIWTCHHCEFTSKHKNRAWEHVEAKHLTTDGYTCPLCQKFCPTSSSLRNHNDRHHRQNKNPMM